MIPKGAPLDVPKRDSKEHKRNFISSAVCELRFPINLDFEEALPREFRKALKSEYPRFVEGKRYKVGADGVSVGEPENAYELQSKNQQWKVIVKPTALALETTQYTNFDDYFRRFERLLDSVWQFLDTDFVTRVGLRYINYVPIDNNDVEGWINDDLVLPLKNSVFGDVYKLHSEVRGYVPNGEYCFRHGIGEKQDPTKPFDRYFLDFDYYRNDVEYDELFDIIRSFNETNYSFFFWCLGPKAIDKLDK